MYRLVVSRANSWLQEVRMDKKEFDTRFSLIAQKLYDAQNDYEFKTEDDIWSNIGTNRLDIAFTELSELYFEADDVQWKYIFDRAGSDGVPYNLWYFVRRVGKLIRTKEDDKWLRIGITAALIDGGRGDFRDLTLSLTLLRSDAEKQGIDPKPYFAEPIQNADEKMKSILINVQDEKKQLWNFWIVVVLVIVAIILLCFFAGNLIGK